MFLIKDNSSKPPINWTNWGKGGTVNTKVRLSEVDGLAEQDSVIAKSWVDFKVLGLCEIWFTKGLLHLEEILLSNPDKTG